MKYFIGMFIGGLMMLSNIIGLVDNTPKNDSTNWICLLIGVSLSVYCFLTASKREKAEKEKREKALQQLEQYNQDCANEPLTEIEQTDLILPADEVCYYNRVGSWSASKMVVKAINYMGSRYKYSAGKNLSFSIGSMKPVAIKESVWDRIDNGDIYITNKRIIFNGGKKTLSIKLSNILDIDLFAMDGLLIAKNSGDKELFKFDNVIDSIKFNHTLNKALNA